MQSYIKKSALIREFRTLISGKSKNIVLALDDAFFKIINNIFKKKPHDVKLHVTKENSLVFSVEFSNNINAYLEYFPQNNPSTLLTIDSNDEYEMCNEMESGDLGSCLDVIDRTILPINDSANTNS